MSFNLSDHFERVRSALQSKASVSAVADWVQKHTFINGQPFSFKNHEYQARILESEAPEIVVKKCSQVGISEMSFRRTLALLDLFPGFTTIYTLPTAKFAANVMKTRVDQIIQSSPRLSERLSRSVDNTEIKQIGESFLYLKGTIGSAQAISVPADMLVHDEVDFSDQEVISNYQSRLTHSLYKWKFYLSTPTTAGYGIDAKFQATRRFFNMVRCCHCGHYFIPDFLEHCHIPGYSGQLLDITSNNIHSLRVDEAALHCPACGGVPDLSPEFREWVCENPDQQFIAEGFQVSPFDAPAYITVPFLVRASTQYKRKTDFINFNLGQCAEDADSGLQAEDIRRMYDLQVNNFVSYVMGMDMGTEAHYMVAGVDVFGKVSVIETGALDYRQLEPGFFALCARYNFSAVVMDSQPYVETVYRLQQRCPVLYGSVYVRTRSLEIFKLRDQDEESTRGLLDVRQVNVNRDYALDALMEAVRGEGITIREDENREKIEKHLRDMKRVKEFGSTGEERFVWKKSDKGEDHFHHALLYTFVASRLRGVNQFSLILPPTMGSFKLSN